MHASLAQDTAACQHTVSRFRAKLRHSAVERLHAVLRSTPEHRSCHKSSLNVYCMSQKMSTPDTRRVLTRQQAIAVYDRYVFQTRTYSPDQDMHDLKFVNLKLPARIRAGKAIKDSSSIYGGLTAWQRTTSQTTLIKCFTLFVGRPCHQSHATSC